jgi:putative glutamine amidotransferase
MKNSGVKVNRVYCSDGYSSAANWITGLKDFVLVPSIKDADVVVFGGGKDIDPAFYGENRGTNTDKPSLRDVKEQADFFIAKERGIKMVGVCRGGQLICALSGGKLIQDVNNHAGSNHPMRTSDGRSYMVNSLHHQMMFPYTLAKTDYEIIGWSPRHLATRYLGGNDKDILLPGHFKECEVVHFKNTKGLAIQWHPEMMYGYSKTAGPSVHWMQETFLKFYNDEL